MDPFYFSAPPIGPVFGLVQSVYGSSWVLYLVTAVRVYLGLILVCSTTLLWMRMDLQCSCFCLQYFTQVGLYIGWPVSCSSYSTELSSVFSLFLCSSSILHCCVFVPLSSFSHSRQKSHQTLMDQKTRNLMEGESSLCVWFLEFYYLINISQQ